MAIGNIYEAALIFSHVQATGLVVNVLHYEQTVITVAKTEPQYCNELAAEVRNICETDWLPDATDDLTLERVDVFNVDQPTFQGTASSGVQGGSVGDSLSPRQAAVATKLTGLRGKSFRGRMYIPGLSEGDQNAGQIEVATVAKLQTYVDNLISLVLSNANEYQQSVYSRKGAAGTQITTIEVKNDIGTIRGRKKVIS